MPSGPHDGDQSDVWSGCSFLPMSGFLGALNPPADAQDPPLGGATLGFFSGPRSKRPMKLRLPIIAELSASILVEAGVKWRWRRQLSVLSPFSWPKIEGSVADHQTCGTVDWQQLRDAGFPRFKDSRLI